MKKLYLAVALVASFGAGVLVSAQVRDWHDLDGVQKHVVEAIKEMDRARAANHYDMAGHGAKAEQYLQQAERELDLAIRSMKGM